MTPFAENWFWKERRRGRREIKEPWGGPSWDPFRMRAALLFLTLSILPEACRG